MKSLPHNVQAYKKTNIFDENSIPLGLLKDHQTLPNVWGKIIVLEGSIIYTIQGDHPEEILLDDQSFGVVEPQVFHFVRPVGKVKFYVEFYK